MNAREQTWQYTDQFHFLRRGPKVPTAVSSPGLRLPAEKLRELGATLGELARSVERDACEQLELDDPSIDVTVAIELPRELAGPAGKALRSIDVAWRLASAIAERSPDQMPSRGMVPLDELVPAEEFGLHVVSVEIASLHITLKPPDRSTLSRASTTLQVAAALASASGYSARDLVNSQAARADGTPCAVQFVGEHPEYLSEMMREELPGLSPGCKVTIEGTSPNGAHFRAVIQVPSN
jgi:hypothetical protein